MKNNVEPKTKLDTFEITKEEVLKEKKNGYTHTYMHINFKYKPKVNVVLSGTIKIYLDNLAPLGRLLVGFKKTSFTLQTLSAIKPTKFVTFKNPKEAEKFPDITKTVMELYMMKRHGLLNKISKMKDASSYIELEKTLPYNYYDNEDDFDDEDDEDDDEENDDDDD